MINKANNARFWAPINGDVAKITLKPKQKLSYFCHTETEDEVYEEVQRWTHTGNRVIRVLEISSDTKDGNQKKYIYVSKCKLEKLMSNIPKNKSGEEVGIEPLPAWETVSSEERDENSDSITI